MPRPRKTRDPEETREKLLASAEREFNTRGFFGTDTNRVTIIYEGGQRESLSLMSKSEVADAIIERIVGLLE